MNVSIPNPEMSMQCRLLSTGDRVWLARDLQWNGKGRACVEVGKRGGKRHWVDRCHKEHVNGVELGVDVYLTAKITMPLFCVRVSG